VPRPGRLRIGLRRRRGQAQLDQDRQLDARQLRPGAVSDDAGDRAAANVYTGLVTYRHAEGAAGTKVVPGLAEALPTVSADRKTYVFKLRPGLKYSDGSPVEASDFEHTIKRLNHLSGMFAPFTASIAGMDEYRSAKSPDADISGITADDAAGRITVKLSKPDGTFLNAIALPNAAPTPAAKSPFKGSRTIPGIGPYTIDIVDPARRFVLTKTPGFDLPGVAHGNIDTITVTKGTVPRITQDVSTAGSTT
jgi:peptide/nickel transport system substrate-binding protein